VDLPVVGSRRRDARNGMQSDGLSARLRMAEQILARPGWLRRVALGGRPLVFGNLSTAVPGARNPAAFRRWIDAQFDPAVTWKDLDWVRAAWPGPLVLKGILDPADARLALQAGADGIVVSNHGGRQLDGAPSSISALPAIAEAVGDRLCVLMDGGVRTGADLLRALALGARACMVGRPWAYGLAADGERGVAKVLQLFRAELRVAMALTGTLSPRQAGPDTLV
jgi:L-lactate dehydrogenase (cytochrome)